MDAFQHIVPCGIANRGVTSLALLMGNNAPSMVEVQQRVVEQFSAVFGVRVVGE
jgi:lipoate-protein ligase B